MRSGTVGNNACYFTGPHANSPNAIKMEQMRDCYSSGNRAEKENRKFMEMFYYMIMKRHQKLN